jgi:hypothetical protein
MHQPTTELQRLIVGATVLLALAISFAMAQGGQRIVPLKYDATTEAKVNAIVEELRLPAKGSEKEAAHLLVKNGTDMLDVYLCPASFLKDMGVSFTKGDEIALTGSKIKRESGELFLAKEVIKGTDTLVLRDEKGSPVWSGHR